MKALTRPASLISLLALNLSAASGCGTNSTVPPGGGVMRADGSSEESPGQSRGLGAGLGAEEGLSSGSTGLGGSSQFGGDGDLGGDGDGDTGGDGDLGGDGDSGGGPDADGDGVPDDVERPGGVDQDTDGDMIPDHLDADDDGDGVLTKDELGDGEEAADSDGDDVPDYLDDDDDGDGIPTLDELGSDPNKPLDSDDNGIPDYRDGDDDGDGILTLIERGDGDTPQNSDGDETPDYLDEDDDNDRILTKDEGPDPDENGLPDDARNTDGDELPDYLDDDDDNDGKTTQSERPGDKDQDSDNDKKPDHLDANDHGIPKELITGVVVISDVENADSEVNRVWRGIDDDPMSRSGHWFTYNDQQWELTPDTSLQVPWPRFTCDPLDAPPCDGLISTDSYAGLYSVTSRTKTMSTTFAEYLGFGLDFNNEGVLPAEKDVYDVSAFSGISFRMKGEVKGGEGRYEDKVLVSVPTLGTAETDLGGICDTNLGSCNNHFGLPLSVGAAWSAYSLQLAAGELNLERDQFWGQDLATLKFNPANALGLLFELKGDTPSGAEDGHSFELFVDAVRFHAPIDDFDGAPEFPSVATSTTWKTDGGALATQSLGGSENAAVLNASQVLSAEFSSGADYDASSYAGLTFRVPSSATATLRVEVPTSDTSSVTGHFGMLIDTSSDEFLFEESGGWKTFVVKFRQEEITGPFGVTPGIEETKLTGLRFEVLTATAAVLIDEVEFF